MEPVLDVGGHEEHRTRLDLHLVSIRREAATATDDVVDLVLGVGALRVHRARRQDVEARPQGRHSQELQPGVATLPAPLLVDLGKPESGPFWLHARSSPGGSGHPRHPSTSRPRAPAILQGRITGHDSLRHCSDRRPSDLPVWPGPRDPHPPRASSRPPSAGGPRMATPQSFSDFCEAHFIADPGELAATFQRLEKTFEQVDGHLHEVRRELTWPIDVDTGAAHAGGPPVRRARPRGARGRGPLPHQGRLPRPAQLPRAHLGGAAGRGAGLGPRDLGALPDDGPLRRRASPPPCSRRSPAVSIAAEQYVSGYNLRLDRARRTPGRRAPVPRGPAADQPLGAARRARPPIMPIPSRPGSPASASSSASWSASSARRSRRR